MIQYSTGKTTFMMNLSRIHYPYVSYGVRTDSQSFERLKQIQDSITIARGAKRILELMNQNKQKEKQMAKVTPLNDRVLVLPVDANEKELPSGIVIPDTADDEKPIRGTIVAVGTGRLTEDGAV